MMRYKWLWLSIALLGLQCQKFTDNTSRLRVENVSPYNFDAVSLWSTDYGSVKAGATSQYIVVETMYNKVSVEVEVDTFKYAEIVIDYVGETPLTPGDFTLQVDLSEPTQRGEISQVLVRNGR